MSTKRCSSCKQQKPLGEFHKRRASNDGLAYRCADCVRLAVAEWRDANPGAFKRWYENNKEERAEYWQAWYAENRETRAESYKEWLRTADPEIKQRITARRQAAKKQATPPWADKAAINAFYREAARLTRQTGIEHQVDHIIPLQGKDVCGLHYAGNLQILTRSENARKRNKMPVEPS